MSRRTERVGRRIQQELSSRIPFLKNPDIGFVTVTHAEPSPDLSVCKVYVSILPTRGNEDVEKSLEALRHSQGFLQAQLGPALKTRVTPELRFYLDERLKKADEIGRLIDQARASDPDREDEEAEADEDANAD